MLDKITNVLGTAALTIRVVIGWFKSATIFLEEVAKWIEDSLFRIGKTLEKTENENEK